MAYNENGLECLEPNSLKLTANSMKETVEHCLEENRKIKHALSAYRECLTDDVSGNTAEVISAIHKNINRINTAYVNAYRQLGIASEMLEKYEALSK